ncbi:MAG: hypothetical protein LKH93_19840 [Clostridium beijerinckii]|jgi:hypothetical protein|nr:hypothetical protein [Clostridium beijerinckii]MCI1578956.1 hypothetical protein [Clostridium beijerinckii]MCI1585078.1 hypothetical protein [Clostridium beijerinckii]MCI1624427.1 hypothetical protein [Clostridium beijerinckii]
MIIENKMSEVIKNMKVTSDKSTKDRLLESYFTLGNEIRYVRIKADDSKKDQYELIKNKITDILDIEGLLEKQVADFAKSYDRFVLKNLDEIKHPYVGWKISDRETTDFFIDKKPCSNYLKVGFPMEYIGFDHDYEVQYYINQGYNVLDKKNLEEVRGIIR